VTSGCPPLSGCAYTAGEIEELRRREREQGIEPDWEIEAFMKASIRTGKRNNIRTDYTLRLLGLEVRRCSDGCSKAI